MVQVLGEDEPEVTQTITATRLAEGKKALNPYGSGDCWVKFAAAAAKGNDTNGQA